MHSEESTIQEIYGTKVTEEVGKIASKVINFKENTVKIRHKKETDEKTQAGEINKEIL